MISLAMRARGRAAHTLAALATRATLVAAAAGCTAPASAPGEDAPYVLVLGTAQDGGLPQIGCTEPPCARARLDPTRRRLVTSRLLADPRSGRRWLFDATPDIASQVEAARPHPAGRANLPGRPPLFDGIFLTHAHMGHYAGLFALGNEAYGGQGNRLFVTARMAAFLAANDPWRWMIANEFLSVEPLGLLEDRPVRLASDLSVTAIPVPHRDEFSDTVCFLIRGPDRAVLFLPDIDKWERFARPIESLIEQVDVAYLDGTFYADGEIPGRSMKEILHPFIAESLQRFAGLAAAERRKIRFIHLNHTNPAADPDSSAARRVRAAGFGIARDGERVTL